jgi:hypothetical protein
MKTLILTPEGCNFKKTYESKDFLIFEITSEKKQIELLKQK